MFQMMPDKYGRVRPHTLVVCEQCGKEFWKPSRFVEEGKKNFCSHECHSRSQKNRITLVCLYCGKPFERVASKVSDKVNFCSRECKDKAQRLESGFPELHLEHYNNGVCNYRDKALREYGCKCSHCGYDDYVEVLEVHHIDGNRENNNIENLIVLCRNCHALITMGLAVIENRKLVILGPVA